MRKCNFKRHMKYYSSNFSIKDFMEKNFGNSIEEGLFKIEKNKKMICTEFKKKEKSICSDDRIVAQSDPFTIEGCCYELAVFLLKNKKSEQAKV